LRGGRWGVERRGISILKEEKMRRRMERMWRGSGLEEVKIVI
jgi:hypothetical protein